MNIKRIDTHGLHVQLAEVKAQIERTEERIRRPPPFSHYDPRNDLALVKELNKYVGELNAEINRRAAQVKPNQD